MHSDVIFSLERFCMFARSHHPHSPFKFSSLFSLFRLGGTWLFEHTTSGDARSLKIEDLDPVTTYRVRVTATTAAGEGETSRVITPRTGDGIPRSAPENVEAEALNKTAIKVGKMEMGERGKNRMGKCRFGVLE